MHLFHIQSSNYGLWKHLHKWKFKIMKLNQNKAYKFSIKESDFKGIQNSSLREKCLP